MNRDTDKLLLVIKHHGENMKILAALLLSTFCLTSVTHARSDQEAKSTELIAEGVLPAIHKLEFTRSGGGEKSFEITSSHTGYLLLLKTFNFRDRNRTYSVINSELISKLDKLFKQNNPYKHYSNYHDNPTGTWQSWEFYNQAGDVLLRIDDQEYANGLDINGIEYLVRQIVESQN